MTFAAAEGNAWPVFVIVMLLSMYLLSFSYGLTPVFSHKIAYYTDILVRRPNVILSVFIYNKVMLLLQL